MVSDDAAQQVRYSQQKCVFSTQIALSENRENRADICTGADQQMLVHNCLIALAKGVRL